MECNKTRKQRRVLNCFRSSGLARDAIPMARRKGCSQKIVDTGVPTKIDRSGQTRHPQKYGECDDSNVCPVLPQPRSPPRLGRRTRKRCSFFCCRDARLHGFTSVLHSILKSVPYAPMPDWLIQSRNRQEEFGHQAAGTTRNTPLSE